MLTAAMEEKKRQQAREWLVPAWTLEKRKETFLVNAFSEFPTAAR